MRFLKVAKEQHQQQGRRGRLGRRTSNSRSSVAVAAWRDSLLTETQGESVWLISYSPVDSLAADSIFYLLNNCFTLTVVANFSIYYKRRF